MTEKNADKVLRNTFAKLDQILAERRSDKSGSGTSKTEKETGDHRQKTAHDQKRAEGAPRLK